MRGESGTREDPNHLAADESSDSSLAVLGDVEFREESARSSSPSFIGCAPARSSCAIQQESQYEDLSVDTSICQAPRSSPRNSRNRRISFDDLRGASDAKYLSTAEREDRLGKSQQQISAFKAPNRSKSSRLRIRSPPGASASSGDVDASIHTTGFALAALEAHVRFEESMRSTRISTSDSTSLRHDASVPGLTFTASVVELSSSLMTKIRKFFPSEAFMRLKQSTGSICEPYSRNVASRIHLAGLPVCTLLTQLCFDMKVKIRKYASKDYEGIGTVVLFLFFMSLFLYWVLPVGKDDLDWDMADDLPRVRYHERMY